MGLHSANESGGVRFSRTSRGSRHSKESVAASLVRKSDQLYTSGPKNSQRKGSHQPPGLNRENGRTRVTSLFFRNRGQAPTYVPQLLLRKSGGGSADSLNRGPPPVLLVEKPRGARPGAVASGIAGTRAASNLGQILPHDDGPEETTLKGGRLRARLKVAAAPPASGSFFIGGTRGPASPTCSVSSKHSVNRAARN